jgi:hypothetical protein
MAMLRTKSVLVALLYVLASGGTAGATPYFDVGLHGRVQLSDTIVLARVLDPARALVSVERVLKGEAPNQITLVAYIDGFAGPAQRKPLLADTRELLFLTKKGDTYAPCRRLIDLYALRLKASTAPSQLVTWFQLAPVCSPCGREPLF